jgi:hypothetical protein
MSLAADRDTTPQPERLRGGVGRDRCPHEDRKRKLDCAPFRVRGVRGNRRRKRRTSVSPSPDGRRTRSRHADLAVRGQRNHGHGDERRADSAGARPAASQALVTERLAAECAAPPPAMATTEAGKFDCAPFRTQAGRGDRRRKRGTSVSPGPGSGRTRSRRAGTSPPLEGSRRRAQRGCSWIAMRRVRGSGDRAPRSRVRRVFPARTTTAAGQFDCAPFGPQAGCGNRRAGEGRSLRAGLVVRPARGARTRKSPTSAAGITATATSAARSLLDPRAPSPRLR